jgi:uncharacterized protein (UPF0297 family)
MSFQLINIEITSQSKEYYYTTIENIYKLEKDMSYNRVNDILGVLPNDIYVDYNNGKKIVSYLYKNRYHEIPSVDIDKEVGLSGGSPKYISNTKEDKVLFCVFNENDNSLETYITSVGREQAIKVLKDEQNLKSFIESPAKPKKFSKSKGNKSRGKSLKLSSGDNSVEINKPGVKVNFKKRN